MRWGWAVVALAAVLSMAPGRAGAAPEPVLVDDFQTPGGWTVSTSPGAQASVTWERAEDGSSALRLDYTMPPASGFVILRHPVKLRLPDNFAFTFRLRGDSPANTFEFKIVDPDGRNVWWRRQSGFSYPRDWQPIVIRRSRLAFAWGPSGGEGGPRDVGAIELALSGGTGGTGTIWLDDLRLEPREPAGVGDVPPVVTASSARAGFEPGLVVDGQPTTRWRSDATADPQWLQLDFGRPREYGGLVIDWDPIDYALAYEVQVSVDGATWTTMHRTDTGRGGRDYVYMPDAESRFVRLALTQSSRGRGFAISEIAVKSVEFSESPNAFFAAIAYDAPPGTYPKYLHGLQTYWTVVGVDGDGRAALMNEEGMVEVDRAFSIEPFLYVDGRLVTWHDAEITQELEQGALPMPSVVWRRGGLRLRVTAFADGAPGASTLLLRYRVENQSGSWRAARLFLAIRPFQVTPPWQSLNMQGGVTQVREIRFDGRTVWVDRTRAVVPIGPIGGFGASTFEDGPITDALYLGAPPDDHEVTDPFGFASGALQFDFRLAAGQAGEAAVAVPLHPEAGGALPAAGLAGVAAAQDDVRGDWSRLMARVDLDLPPAAASLVQALRSTIAYILVNRDGPALRPGSRNYARSWIRDGAMMSEALLQMGFNREVRDFVAWYAGFQRRKDGAIPCAIDARGPDFTPEHDSEGAFIYALAEYYRYTRDAGFVHDVWPSVLQAVERIAALRAQRTTAAYRAADRREYFGLLPESISHEGYAGHPVHSYWDDFFALRGLKDAAWLAGVVGDDDHAADFGALRDAFRVSLLASLDASMARHGIDYVPGSVELGDYDPTSTSIAIVPGGELQHLPADAVRRTYEKYWSEIEQRLAGTWGGQAYSPYELRNVGVFVRLGWRDRAHRLLDLLMRGRRPTAWNEWAEVVWLDKDLPRFIGDMPHTWAAAGLVQAVRSMLAYEREADQSLVIGAGVPPEWMQAGGLAVRRLPTHYGTLNMSMRLERPDVVRVRLSGDVTIPPGRLVVSSPLDRPLIAASVNGRPLSPDPQGVVVDVCPADVELRYAPAEGR